MAPILEWKKIMRVDPDALPHQEELADSLFETVAKVDGNALKDETPAHLIQLFKISQSLMKMKNQEVELALEEVEKAGEEQAKFENQLKTKVMKLEKELEIAQRSTGSRDTRFLRDEIRQLEKQLSQKDRELADMEKDLEKEKKANEQLTLRNAETENENSKLRRENEQFRQDVIDYQRQLETQKETLLSRRGEESDYRSQLSKKNFELVQYLDEIQNLTEANEKLEAQSQEMRKNLEESVQEMENMTDEYNKMKFMVQQSDIAMDQLRKEKEQFRLQVHELTEQLKAKNEEDDPLMAAVNEKVEDWKRILASKDDEIIEYQEMLLTLKEKLKMAQMDADKSNILALQQGVQERDRQIKLLTEQIEQYTKEMEKNVLIIEDLKRELQKDKSELSVTHQDRIGEMRGKLQMLEEKIKETERTAELAEADAREKDKELIETLKRVKDYETGIYGLEDAVAEIKGLKKQLKIRNSEIESLIKEVNKLEFKINDLLDENEDLREQLGLDPKTMIDLTELKKSKALKQQQYKAENQVLLKEIERLEEERVTLKQQIRKLAQEKGRRAATLGLDADDLQLIDNFTEDLKMKRERPELMSTSNFDKLKTKFHSQLAPQVQVEDNSDSSKAFTVDELYNSLEQTSTEILGTALCSVSNKNLNSIDCSVSFSVLERTEKDDKKHIQREEREMKKMEASCQAQMPLCSVQKLFLDSSLFRKPMSSYIVQEILLKNEKDNSEVKLMDLRTDLQDTGKDLYFSESWPVELLEGEFDCDQSLKAYQIDRVENLIRQLRSEIMFLRSENEQILRDLFAKNTLNKNAELELDRCRSQKFENDYLAKELNEREKNLEQNRIVIMKLKSNLKELVQENKHLQQGMKEILQAIKDMQNDPGVKDGENALMIPSLERLVNAIELKNAEGAFDASLHLRAQVDQLTGRNEELRKELRESRKEAINFSNQLAKANTKIANLENEIDMLKKSEGGSIVFKSLNLPEGISPSSVNIINSQNEYLIHLLQEFENKEQLFKKLEEAIEEYKRKFAVIRHQQGLLYKEYQSEREHWQVANEKILQEKKRLEYQKEEDDIKIKEYTDLLDALEKDSDDTKQLFVDYSRKINVLRVNERSMTRQYATLLEMERHLRKENEKMKTEMVSVEVTVREKIGSLQRFKEMATFKIAALQKALDDSVPLNDLEMANKQYNELTAKYRDMLQKDNLLIQRTNNVERLEHENTSLKNQIESLNKELEITKEKLHTIEQAWEQTAKLGDSTTDKATKAITNSEIVSISKKITMLEMKELNERQRAEHCQRMYEHLRNTLKQAEERNFELETKFAELTKINLEAQKVEQSLRDELSNSVSKGINEVDKRRIMELEKSETELKIEASKLRELSDIAKTQVTALENRQQLRDKEVESLRMQILDYQVQSDEKTLIAKLHQHIVALQVSEATAITKLAAAASKLQKTEIANMRLEQKLDDKQQALYYARLEGRNRVKHLRQTVQSLRRQFSGALPLAQQEKFSKTMIQLQNDKLKTMEDIQQAQQERRNAENRAVELEMKLKGIEELVATLKDARGAQKVIEWHVKIEELRLQELKLNRELSRKNEEIKYLKNILSEYEQTINHLEEEIVQQGKFHEERQMAWDKREVELERQLDIYDSQKQDILSTAQKFNEAAGTVPDPSLPLPHQLEQALKTVREQSRTILEMQVTCKSVEEKLKEKEAALWKAEQNILSRDKVINELRLQLPASSEREKLVVQLDQIDDYTHPHALKIAHQTIANMQARLNQKEEILKKYQHLLAKAREEQEEIAKKHEEDLRVLHQKLDVHVDSSFNKFKQTALELIQKPSLAVPASKHLIRLAELEQTIAEQDSSLNSLLSKLKKTSSDLQKQKQITAVKIKEFDNIRAQLEEKHQDRVKKLQDEIEELRSLLSKMGKELLNVKSELEMQREANNRSPTTTMKNLVERLKNQLALKEKQQKALSKALLELRAEMTAAAEQQIISVASQKEAHMNVQQIVDKHTKELRGQIEDLNDQLLKHKDALKLSKNKESSLLDDMDDLNQELQKKMKAYTKVLREKDDIEKENEELKKQNKRLTSSIQSKADEQTLIDELQRKIKRMETELGKKSDESEKKNPREERVLKSPREELIRWEECKKWQTKADGMRNKLKEKEKEIESLSKQLNTIKELFSKGEKEKNALQKKLKSCSVTVDHVIGVRASESERELEELHKRNMDLENEIVHLKTQYAVPRDTVVEDLHLKNRYLQEKLLVLEKQLPRDTCSRPSTSGIGSDDQHQKEQELQKENLILSSENMELRFQLEQANKDLPRLKNQVADLKEMCELLKREKGETERKLGNVRGAGRSGKTIPELEKTIGLMKKVVERVQRENEELKRAPGVVSNEKVARLEQENEDLRSEMEKLKLHFGSELSARYELKTKGTEKIIAENDRIRKELKKEVENAEKLRMAKNNLEIINGKLNVELEETTKKLNLAENRIPKLEDADTKNWKSIVITRMFENKLKEMESEIARKNQTISDLKQKLQKPTESGEKNENYIEDYLKAQAEVLKSVPEDTKTEQEYVRENQLLRLTNDRLEKEKAELIYLMGSSRNQTKLKGDDLAAEKTGNYKLVAEVTDLKTQLKSSEVEQQRLHEEIKKLKNELDHFDPAFFEEIEDLKYNYNEEVKKNIILEEKLKTVSEKFGVQVDIPGRISID
ncbi:centrosomal protein of 290 kDa isoform X5 [Crotalus tigris]|uniref:centrosomal protein of 290 kDa isoform X5 n=1 Tax=Crotalus tigris TaxID=88082 RepID=UPI00192F679E|nr:centrosomal protein of 290 kDa isoform X5 [Crotalus tigris]